jgi:hypothetical protein
VLSAGSGQAREKAKTYANKVRKSLHARKISELFSIQKTAKEAVSISVVWGAGQAVMVILESPLGRIDIQRPR